ncbi:DMT family transporter [Paenibacillus sp. YAF4_2]|uniref:DMT family transporter n=1 Tax=Paenibacillus sp. YAF4_2 TaxID=3233085 RepID=UPI003F9AFB0E
MSWIFLVIAGLLEVVGVIGIKQVAKKNNWPNNLLMIVAFIISFQLLLQALETIPLSTGYAVWTGIGTVGGAIVGMLFYKEPRNPKRILFIAGIICCIVSLKLIDS